MWFLGIDLAGSEKQKTGVCLLNEGLIVKTWVFYPNEEILKLVKSLDKKVRIIAIDAPLSLPSGRETIDDRNGPHFRQCDRDLRKLGIPFFPITLGPMRLLTKRGMELKEKLEKDFVVIETYPGGSADLLGLPRSKNIQGLTYGLRRMGVRGIRKEISRDEADAILSALASKAFAEKRAKIIGDRKEGQIVLCQ